MLAKSVNDHAPSLSQRGALTFFASKLAPTETPNFSVRCQPCYAADFLRHCIVIFLSYRIARVCA
ncbi:hypothetical protein GDV60_00310 [Pseudomonas sp. DTU12.1]|nr:hypothetical protein GDV60_00310 [Pseudomonas sp. DTU12.1]